MAVNVTDVPAQIVVALAPIETLGVTLEFTTMVTELEVAVVGEAQANDEVITQLTTSPFTKAVLDQVTLLPPTFDPFNFH